VRDLGLPLPPVPASPLTSWSTLSACHFDALQAMDPAMTLAEIGRRLSDGQVCHLGWVGVSLAYSRWETTKPTYVPYVGKAVRPLTGQLHIGEVVTAPAFRRRGIDSAGAIQSLHWARAQGLRQSIVLVAWWNVPSLRVAGDKAGHQTRGVIGYWTLGRWRRYLADGAVRFDTENSYCVDA
jgi:GNAT superfamily N-acetyltransferase